MYLTILATIATIALVWIAVSLSNVGYFFNPRLLGIQESLNNISRILEDFYSRDGDASEMREELRGIVKDFKERLKRLEESV